LYLLWNENAHPKATHICQVTQNSMPAPQEI
jgi:hypothetical protein